MKIIVFKHESEQQIEYSAFLVSDRNLPILKNWYDNISDVYDFANWACGRYNTVVNVEFRK